ncbi:Peptidoglycan/LPS O-acetylase OafA/YrhL, contains acyltransferase and SGNH-hydrolase domains [Sphingomonas gellani]|uniref:Peptidoglycan/LPS O-acetylase OafA/YrhL, contains acyltransferase and SGNH-hydrolase domains n=1 Tax=Sphingomonas gellani TaxID=1166340 RepID=A0A1H7YRM1_9SPHN|nr:acyltransferase [Sphingomonas gellani]SEM47938.1 Peptidoglycan/LPS O-acetylase OafA/YrhL, contains acyltransferase and SGNH-hydrolase domains [Sphingomonas gellani]
MNPLTPDTTVMPPHAGAVRRDRLAALDGLRGLSALAVCLFHYTYMVQFMIPGAPLPAAQVWWGCYGVQLFFAISGFVILGSLARTRNVPSFARARAMRLLPEYWIAMTVTAALLALLGPTRLQVSPIDWLWNLPMLQLWSMTPMIDGVYWSLNLEVGFYAAMALIWRLGGTRRIETVVLCWLGVKWLFWLTEPNFRLALLFLTDQAAFFAIGLVTYRVWSGERHWTEQLPVIAAIGVTVFLTDPIHAHWLFLGMVPLFLLLAKGRLGWLAHPVLIWMGWLSYPFYLLHGAIGYAVIARLESVGIGPLLATLVALALTGSLAFGVATLCERARALAARRATKRPSATAAPALA